MAVAPLSLLLYFSIVLSLVILILLLTFVVTIVNSYTAEFHLLAGTPK